MENNSEAPSQRLPEKPGLHKEKSGLALELNSFYSPNPTKVSIADAKFAAGHIQEGEKILNEQFHAKLIDHPGISLKKKLTNLKNLIQRTRPRSEQVQNQFVQKIEEVEKTIPENSPYRQDITKLYADLGDIEKTKKAA